MTAPYEIIAAPFKVWLAPVGEAMANVNTVPAGNWVTVGTSGDKSIHEDGVSVTHAQSMEYIRTLGATGPVKAIRTEEDLKISFTLLDLTLEEYKHVLGEASVSQTAAASGVGGYKIIPLNRGITVNQRAMLIRGPSPYGAGWNLQYEIPRVVHVGEPELVFKKGEAAGLLFEFQAIEDPDFAGGVFGRIVAQDAEAL